MRRVGTSNVCFQCNENETKKWGKVLIRYEIINKIDHPFAQKPKSVSIINTILAEHSVSSLYLSFVQIFDAHIQKKKKLEVNKVSLRFTMYVTTWLLLVTVVFSLYTLIRFFVKFNRRKRRILKYVQHLSSPKEYPVIGSGLRFFGKSSEGKDSKTQLK